MEIEGYTANRSKAVISQPDGKNIELTGFTDDEMVTWGRLPVPVANVYIDGELAGQAMMKVLNCESAGDDDEK